MKRILEFFSGNASTKRLMAAWCTCALVVQLVAPVVVLAESGTPNTAEYSGMEIIVKYDESKIDLNDLADQELVHQAHQEQSLDTQEVLEDQNISVVAADSGVALDQIIAELESDPNVEYAEPNYPRTMTVIATDDAYRDRLWGLDNTGQTVNGTAGTVDADMDVPEAWEITEGADHAVVVAVIDSGVLYTHPDLDANMWDGTNCKDETGADLGGCLHGYDYENEDADPLPPPPGGSAFHGTHVAGIIAAEKNNGAGVMGIAPHAKIMAIRFGLNVSSEVKAIDFAIQNGATIINASFGGAGFSSAEYEAIERFKDAGGIFIAAAGNDGTSNDDAPVYPASYDLPNIIAVAATDQDDQLASFSNYGATTVDVAAPGNNIASTGLSDGYVYANGTSMAAPYVAGLAALLWGTDNTLTYDQVKTIIMDTGDAVADLDGVTVTGKRVNAHAALESLGVESGSDTTAPVITLNGNSSVSVRAGRPYVDAGATASDDRDGDITDNIVVENPVNTDRAGTYTITYNVSDSSDNAAEQVMRQVIVERSGGGGGGGSKKKKKATTPVVSTPTPASTIDYARPLLTTPAYTVPVTAVFQRTLRFGMTGADVLTLQQKLNARGYVIAPMGPGSLGQETTSFGAKTLIAVQMFQRANGLNPDGVVGPMTWGMLMNY